MSDKTREALAGMLAIVDESRGVDGYHLNGDTAEWDEFPEVEAARAALAQQPAQAAAVPDGWQLVPVEPSIAMEYAGCKAASRLMGFSEANRVYRAMLAAAPAAPVAQEPVACGGCGAADESQRCIGCMHPFNDPPAAEQPDTVAVPRVLLAEAESIIESYAEALKASHAPGGDWAGEEAAWEDYEREAGVASKLRALLAGGES